MSFVGPTTWKDGRYPDQGIGWVQVPTCRSSSKSTMPRPWVNASTASAEAPAISIISILASGSGGCMVQDGNALRGSHGNAGEIGHLPLVPGGEPCPCGNLGCLERYLRWSDGPAQPEIGVRAASKAPLLLRRAIVAIETCSIRRPSLSAALRRMLLAGLVCRRPLPNSGRRSGRTRQSARHAVLPGEDAAVLRAPRLLAVAGVLEPSFGLMFAEDDERQRDPMMQGRNQPEAAA